MKFTSIFFTASASIFEIYLNDTNKRARNMKFTQYFSQRVQVSSRFISTIQINEREKSTSDLCMRNPVWIA